MTFLELFPIVVVAHIWAADFANAPVLFGGRQSGNCMSFKQQNIPITPSYALGWSLCAPVFLQNNMPFSAKHVPGIDNKIANELSRLRGSAFTSLLRRPARILSPSLDGFGTLARLGPRSQLGIPCVCNQGQLCQQDSGIPVLPAVGEPA